MMLDDDSCYQALLAHDARFDGVFFVGVRTTRIYCRTVCRAKTPRRDSCKFYPSAAAAEKAGFRPCLRCRPELAPGNASIDAVSRVAVAAASRIEDGALADRSLEDLAAELGVSCRHLRRAVESEFGVSPVALAQTQRLLLAKRLLSDTDLPVTEIAMASGFASVRRFNALIRERYGVNPTALRSGRSLRAQSQSLSCELAYRPPMDLGHLLAFLSQRRCAGVEAVDGNRYMRTAQFGKHQGWLAVTPMPGKNALAVEVSASLAAALTACVAGVKRLFDVAAEPERVAAHLGAVASANPGLRVPGAFDGFEIAMRAIVGQQISVRAATTVAGRIAGAFGDRLETPFASLTHLTPTAERLADADWEEIAACGLVAARARSLKALAKAVADGDLVLSPGADVDETLSRLKELPGVGEWTAQYIAMRALCWPDAFPHTDLGICKALSEKSPRRILEAAEAWRPWRAYAAMHLWKSLEVVK